MSRPAGNEVGSKLGRLGQLQGAFRAVRGKNASGGGENAAPFSLLGGGYPRQHVQGHTAGARRLGEQGSWRLQVVAKHPGEHRAHAGAGEAGASKAIAGKARTGPASTPMASTRMASTRMVSAGEGSGMEQRRKQRLRTLGPMRALAVVALRPA